LAAGAALPWLLGAAHVVLLPVENGALEWSVSASVHGAPGLAVHGAF
jgi:hypothetical protein